MPNFLTVSRIFLTLVFVFFSLRAEDWAVYVSAAVFSIGAFTDFFDGYLARRNKLLTDFGKIMDPVADKFLVLAAFFVFMKLSFIAPWMFWLIAGREVLVTASRLSLMKKGTILAAEQAGKVKTVIQMVTIVALLIVQMLLHSTDDPASWVFQQGTMTCYFVGTQLLMILTVTLTLYSGVKYFWNNRKELF